MIIMPSTLAMMRVTRSLCFPNKPNIYDILAYMYGFKKSAAPQHVTFRFFVTVLGALCLFVIAIFVARAAFDMYGKFSDASTAADEAQYELAQLLSQEARVSAALDDLSSKRGVEAQVRERFGVALPGEGKIQIVRSESTGDTAQDTSSGNIFIQLFRALFVW